MYYGDETSEYSQVRYSQMRYKDVSGSDKRGEARRENTMPTNKHKREKMTKFMMIDDDVVLTMVMTKTENFTSQKGQTGGT